VLALHVAAHSLSPHLSGVDESSAGSRTQRRSDGTDDGLLYEAIHIPPFFLCVRLCLGSCGGVGFGIGGAVRDEIIADGGGREGSIGGEGELTEAGS
jgi:hypothetical protein